MCVCVYALEIITFNFVSISNGLDDTQNASSFTLECSTYVLFLPRLVTGSVFSKQTENLLRWYRIVQSKHNQNVVECTNEISLQLTHCIVSSEAQFET